MNKIKSNKGITGVDIVLSIGIISITLTILLSMYLSIYISNTEIERKAQAINYATQILEKASELYYADVKASNFTATTLSNGAKEIAGIQIPKGYTVTVNIEPYTNNEQTDVVKKVEVSVNYKISERNENVTLSSYKTKEVLIVPNKPELPTDFVAIKAYKNNGSTTYKTTNATDATWYNYTKKQWALAVAKSDLNSSIDASDLYVWIPRYAYYVDSSSKTNIEFLYSDKNQRVDKLGNLQNLPSGYTVNTKFKDTNAKGYWVLVTDVTTDETANRLNNSIYGNLIY